MRDICILIVDDHNLFRESLKRLLEATPEFRVIGQSATVAGTVEILSHTPADVVLLDYDLGEEVGIDLFAGLKQCRSEAKVLMVTAGLPDETALRAMEAGASGVFRKHNSAEQIISAIRRVADGEIWLENTTLHSLLAGGRNRAELREDSRSLTPRQSAVLRRIFDGLANKEIARDLKISESSVKAVIQELFCKAGVKTRSQLVRAAIEKHSSDWLNPGAARQAEREKF